MSDATVLTVNDRLFLLRSELTYRASRSGGPGGQHVNTSSTRVEVAFDVANSPSLDEEQRSLILEKLANRINSEGEFLLVEGGSRSQHQNKEAVTERLVDMLREALVIQKPRKKTRPPRAAREERLETKKRRSEVKRLRGRVPSE